MGFVDSWAVVGRVATERDIQVLEECVAAAEKGLRLVRVSIDARNAVKDDNPIRNWPRVSIPPLFTEHDLRPTVRCHDKVVLDNEGRL